MTTDLDRALNTLIYDSIRNNILNLYNGQPRNIVNPNRNVHRLRNVLSSRYYNTPPEGGYRINEEHEYTIDHDDISSLIFLDITTRIASPITNIDIKNKRLLKIKNIKYKKVKEQVEECPICLEAIGVGEFQKTLECKHCFHKKCIDRWFKKDNDCCPMCRLNVFKN